MKSLTLFTYNADEFLRQVSKKGTASDIQFHERKTDDVIMTLISPLKYPEKISALTDSIFPSDMALLNISTLNRDLGEVIVALDLMGPQKGFITFSDPTLTDRVAPILKGTKLEKYTISEKQPMELVEDIQVGETIRKSGKTVVMIDHFFGVKSVGTVALGFVLQGNVQKHQDLQLSYTDKEAQVRSIQMHDVDVDEAGPGARVGLALKGVDPEELERGMTLSEEPSKYLQNFEGELHPHKSARNVPEGQFEIFVADRMRYHRGFVIGHKIDLDKRIAFDGNELVVSSNSVTPRAFGKLRIR